MLESAIEAGVTFFDTADVYGDGRSERLVGEFLRGHNCIAVATKMGRRAAPHVAQAYALARFREWTDRSRSNLGVDVLDLVQLHCPPTSVYQNDEVFEALDALVDEGRTRAYGVSVETCDEALRAIARPGVASVQIILNVLRRKPLAQVVPAAVKAGVSVIVRLPLASGLLSGNYGESTTFAADDHRTYNRHGEAFDRGETFAGVPYEVGVAAARDVAALFSEGAATAQLALRWLLDQPGVTTVIPGARNADQARANAAAAGLPPLDEPTLEALAGVYDARVREHVHHLC